MKTCSIWLKHAKNGSNVLKHNVTPAEVMLYAAMFHADAGGNPVEIVLDSEKEVKRSAIEEKRRLVNLFGAKKVNALFPGASPNMPEEFTEAVEAGIGAKMPTERLIDFEVASG